MALVALLMPFLLLRQLPPENFGVWSLVMQIAAYVNVLSFNMQTVVGRYVAMELAADRPEHARRYVSSAAFILVGCGVIATIFVTFAWYFFARLFSNVPPVLADQARSALLVMGVALSVTLPGAALNGVFTGLQKNGVVAAITIFSRIILVAGVVWAAQLTQNIGWMGFVFSIVTILTIIITGWRVSRIIPSLSIKFAYIRRKEVIQIVNYSSSLAIWSICMLLVSGLNSAIVGLFDYSSLPAFAIAASLVAFLVGIQQSIFSVLIPATAKMISENNAEIDFGNLLITATRYGSILLAIVGLPLIIWAHPILALWLRGPMADKGASILRLLIVGNMIRLVAVPFANIMIAAGEQRRMLLTPIIEGVVNFIVSVFLCQKIGAAGVAIGTIVGAIIGISGNILINSKKTGAVVFNAKRYLWEGTSLPFVCFTPMLLAIFSKQTQNYVVSAVVFIVCLFLVFCFSTTKGEKHKLLKHFK